MGLKPRASNFRLSGIRLMSQASLAFSLMVIGVKGASATLPALEVVFFRSLFGSLLMAGLMLWKKVSFTGKLKERKLLLLRSLAGFLALTLHFYTMSVLPLGTAVILNYTGPVFVALLASLFLGERPGMFLAAMIFVSFSGVYFLIQPQFRLDPSQNMAVFLAILSGFFSAVAVLAIRAIGRRESPLTVIFYFTGVSTLGSLLYLPFGFRWPGFREWFFLSFVVIGSFYGQIWMTLAYRRAPASLVSPFAYLTPLLSFFYGLAFWKEALTPRNVLGVFLITLGGMLISIVESRRGPVLTASE